MDPELENHLLIKFKEKKVAISNAVNKLFPFIYSLRDQALISNSMLQHCKNESVPIGQRIYNILEKLEKKFNKKVLKVLFNRNNIMEYPDLKRIRRNFEDVLSDDSSPERSDSEEAMEINNTPRSPQGVINPDRAQGSKPKIYKDKQKRQYLRVVRRGTRHSQSQSVDFNSPQLPVTCSKASGTLYKEKMKKGSSEKCIMDTNGEWFTLREFEIKGERGRFKNWKKSISCSGHTLEWLASEGFIPKPPRQYGIKGVAKKKLPLKQSQTPGREKSQAPADLPPHLERLADTDSFLVACGAAIGILYKERFASGSRGKCIRTDKRWFTPEEFLNSADETDFLSWFKKIHASGIPLQTLIEKKILRLHNNQCICLLCTEGAPHPENDDECAVCTDGGMLICCDSCPNSFHEDCHIPVANSTSPEWICTYCKVAKAQQRCPPNQAGHPELEILKRKMLPEERLKCEFLLLKIFCRQESRIFTKDPNRIRGYYQHIEEPMWLNLIKERLHQEMYNTVEGFVLDMRLIFKNCRKFNKNNKFGLMGIKLKKIFEENFKQVFSIQEIEETS
ncbi:nuclear body protein SP140-like isoform X2 [Tachyglossus aculeatus]|uniref:nuclear body protein SP140-like isoform X2 n=1 Tax=Tachyglossus aculeatus TaxID=9261 RepID=UPI0018F2FCEA|nr:nuclear body protein SP140-like isoform X2 [Tachyglossus aculeatus]